MQWYPLAISKSSVLFKTEISTYQLFKYSTLSTVCHLYMNFKSKSVCRMNFIIENIVAT